MSVFSIDGQSFAVDVTSLKRSGKVTDGKNAGRTADQCMYRDVRGTFYNYSVSLNTSLLSVADYDTLYELLTAPVAFHSVTLPYAQSTYTFDAYVANVDDVLKRIAAGVNYWGDMTFNFIAKAPKRRPA